MTYYDAQVEYLQSSGTQWINTGIKAGTYTYYYKGYLYNNTNAIPFGASYTVFGLWSGGVIGMRYGSKYYNASQSRISYLTNQLNEVTITSSYIDVNGTRTDFGGIYSINTNNVIYLFSDINGTYPFKSKIQQFKITNGDSIILDLIPVRVGTVGYMYDKVSDTLFGNAGTGSFTLGPDVAGWPGMEGTPKVSILRRKLLKFMPKNTLDYLCFTAIDKGTFTLSIPAALTTSNLSYIEYSVDNCNTWVKTNNVTDTAVTITTPEIISGKKVYWRGSGIRTSNSNSSSATYCATFSSTGKYNVSGTLLSLLKGREITTSTTLSYNYTFSGLFRNDTHVVSAENLIFPTNTATYCYDYFFRGCTSLITAPKILPAMTLSSYCYRNMFYGCTSLLRGPELPALTLVGQCYNNMFYGCTKLNYIKMLATNVSATQCLNAWMYNVQTNSGTFIRNPEATWIVVGQHGIQTNWTWFDGTESENDETITFVDPEVERIMVAQWGGKMGGAAAGSTRKCGIGTSTATGIKRGGYADGVIYKKQVETIVTINSQFYQNKVIVDFSDLNKLTSLTTIQSSSSGSNANRGFYQCTNLKYITFPNSLKTLGSGYTYGRGMFKGTALEEVYIPDSVTSMGENTFGDCSKLVSVRWSLNVPIPVYTDGNWAAGTFQNCSNLETLINAPQTITTIRLQEFQRCSKLDFSFLDFTKIATIGQYAFAYDTQLPKNLMLLNCRTLENYFIRDAGTHNLYLPYIRSTSSQLVLCYSSVNIIDYGQDYSSGYINFQNMENNQAVVLRSLSPKNGTAARFTLYSNGSTMARLYVYPEVLDEYKETYTAIASKTYAIGGAEWEAQFGSTDEWADYPDGQAPDVYLSESKVEWVSLARSSVFNTNVVPTSNTRVVIRGNYSTVANTIIAGAHQSNSLRFYMGAVSNTFRFAIGSVEYNTTVPYDTNIHTFEMYGDGKAVLDGTEYATGGTLGTTTTTLTLFGRHTTGTTYNAYATTFRLYSAQIYEGDELIKDYEPYRRRGGIYLHEKVADVYSLIGYIDNTLFGDETE